jgi:hypothetical protein
LGYGALRRDRWRCRVTDIPGQLHHDGEFQRASNTLDAVHAPRDPDLARRIDLLADQRDSARRFAAAVEAQNAAVLALHEACYCKDHGYGSTLPHCLECGFRYPCPTARIVLPGAGPTPDGAA